MKKRWRIIRKDKEEVARVVKLCDEELIPLTPRGAGTGLCGGCVPAYGGIVMDLVNMNEINIDKDNLMATVGAGVSLMDLYKAVEEEGLFFPPHPGDESATVGGVIATNAGGVRAVKYGVIRDFIKGIEVVLPDGKIVNIGGKFIKNSGGKEMIRLIKRLVLICLLVVGSLVLQAKAEEEFSCEVTPQKVVLKSGEASFTFYALGKYGRGSYDWLEVGDITLEGGMGMPGNLNASVKIPKEFTLATDRTEKKVVVVSVPLCNAPVSKDAKQNHHVKLIVTLEIRKGLPCLFVNSRLINVSDKIVNRAYLRWAVRPPRGKGKREYSYCSIANYEMKPMPEKYLRLEKTKPWLFYQSRKDNIGIGFITGGDMTWSPKRACLILAGTSGRNIAPGKKIENSLIVFPAETPQETEKIYMKVKRLKDGKGEQDKANLSDIEERIMAKAKPLSEKQAREEQVSEMKNEAVELREKIEKFNLSAEDRTYLLNRVDNLTRMTHEAEGLLVFDNHSLFREKVDNFKNKSNSLNKELFELSAKRVARIVKSSSSKEIKGLNIKKIKKIPSLWKDKSPYSSAPSCRIEIPYRTLQMFRYGNLDKDPFIQDAVITSRLTKLDGSAYNDILNSGHHIMVDCGHTAIQHRSPLPKGSKETLERVENDFKERYLGGTAMFECGIGKGASDEEYCKTHNLPLPKTREEVYNGYRGFSREHVIRGMKKFLNVACANYEQHLHYEMGASMSCPEIVRNSAFQIAVARGAARQYDRPWGTYHPTCFKGAYQHYKCISPEVRLFNHAMSLWSRYSGTPVSEGKRVIHFSYMSGANLIRNESAYQYVWTEVRVKYPKPFSYANGVAHKGSIFIANYDIKNIDKVDFLVKQLRDLPWHFSDRGYIWRDLYDKIILKHDRGVSYTPVGLVFDNNHGFSIYSFTAIKDYLFSSSSRTILFPYKEGDYMMPGVVENVFPSLGRAHKYHYRSNRLISGPYGDIFDVITNTATQEVLDAYPVLVLTGRVTINDDFAKKLKDYVKRGGTLLINTMQITSPHVTSSINSSSFLGCEITPLIEVKEGKACFSALDRSFWEEEKQFKFDIVKPTKAKPMVYVLDCEKPYPLALVNRFGKGNVILTTPHWLYNKGTKYKMLNLFTYLMKSIKGEVVPFFWERPEDVEVVFNRTEDSWIVTLINNEGVYKAGDAEDERFDYKDTKEVTLTPNRKVFRGKIKRIKEWMEEKELRMDNNKLKVTVLPGQLKIVEFVIE